MAIMAVIGLAVVAAVAFTAGFLAGHVQGQQQSCDKWMQVLRKKEEELRRKQSAMNAPLRTYHKPQWMDNANSEK